MRLGAILMAAPDDPIEARSQMDMAVGAYEAELRKDMNEEVAKRLGPPMGTPPAEATSSAPDEQPAAKNATAGTAAKASGKRLMLVSYDEHGNALRTEAAALAAAGPKIEVLSCTATDRREESMREVAKAKLFEALHLCARAKMQRRA